MHPLFNIMLSGYFLPLIKHVFEFFPPKEWLLKFY